MKVLLLNDNPIIDKLVTLSAQKRGDKLVKVSDGPAYEAGQYDLLIIDESSASVHLPSEAAEHISYGLTLFIASRGTAIPDLYDQTLYKPFLPMELLSIFKKAEEIAAAKPADVPKAEETERSEEEEMDASFILDTPFDEDELMPDVSEPLKSVLNNIDISEVQELLDDVENSEEDAFSDLDDVVLQSEDDFGSDISDLEAQINKAMEALSQEDLLRTVDEEILFDGTEASYDPVGEASIWDAEETPEKETYFGDPAEEERTFDEHTSTEANAKGADALQQMFKMLADPEIAASLRAMNVSVNISFGEKQ